MYSSLEEKIPIIVTGYQHREESSFLLTYTNAINSIINGQILYDIDASEEQCGAPVYITI